MAYDITIAVLADWLPKFEPPFGHNGFDIRYADRLKLELSVEPDETLAKIYRRALEHWQPTVSVESEWHPADLMDVLHWAWFYLPEDEPRLQHRYELAEELVLIDGERHARWNLHADEIPYEWVIRSGEEGLLRGDAHRPYLPMLLPQGGGGFQSAWETLLASWSVLEGLLVAKGVYELGDQARERLLYHLRRRQVVETNSAAWEEIGGSASNVSRTLDRKPWAPDDLRIVMDVETVEDAEDLLALFGHEPDATGLYAIGEADEARILRLAADDVFNTFASGASDEQLRPRLEHLLKTRELPPYKSLQ